MANLHSKVLILGSGPGGYTAAIYAARANLSPLLVAGMQPGGQLVITTDVENYPGFANASQGPWLVEQMRDQVEHAGTRLVQDVVVSVDLSKRPFTCVGDGGDVYTGDTLVITTGASARWLGLPNEQRFQGFGVSACATCDGFFFRGKEVAVVGGGNSAVEESLFLTNMAAKVTLIHRRDSLLRASRIQGICGSAAERTGLACRTDWLDVLDRANAHRRQRERDSKGFGRPRGQNLACPRAASRSTASAPGQPA